MENKLDCILLVDDDVATNFINKRIIQKTNIIQNVNVALNGNEAIDYLTNKGKFESDESKYPKPQLILLDINMPVMDGWEFIEAYQNLDCPSKDKISIVMLSSSFNPADKAKAESIPEISAFMQKPMSKEALLEIITKVFPQVSMEKVE